MIRKTIEISTPGSRLSVSNRQLVIERPEMQRASLPLEDLGVVIVDDRRAIYTQSALIELMSAGATLIITGSDHLPAGMMLPLDAHHVQTERHRAQIVTKEPVRKRIWQELVVAKLKQQAIVLYHFTGETGGLDAMAHRVRSGDPDNLEAQAAQRYWPRLFGKNFRRDHDAEGVNACLNYGYAVIRAAIARSIVAAGLIPSLGVFHKNRSNAFCLADDLFEPYRPFVDWRVKTLQQTKQGEELRLSDKSNRAALLTLFNEGIVIDERRLPMLGAIEASVTSLARSLTGGERGLALPTGLPLNRDDQMEFDGT